MAEYGLIGLVLYWVGPPPHFTSFRYLPSTRSFQELDSIKRKQEGGVINCPMDYVIKTCIKSMGQSFVHRCKDTETAQQGCNVVVLVNASSRAVFKKIFRAFRTDVQQSTREVMGHVALEPPLQDRAQIPVPVTEGAAGTGAPPEAPASAAQCTSYCLTCSTLGPLSQAMAHERVTAVLSLLRVFPPNTPRVHCTPPPGPPQGSVISPAVNALS